VHSVLLKFLLLPALLAVSFGAFADWEYTGNKYADNCQHFVDTNKTDGYNSLSCMMYTDGVLDAYTDTLPTAQLGCWLKRYPHVTNGQMVKLTYQYLQKNPKYLNLNAAYSILMTRFMNFPLPKKCRG